MKIERILRVIATISTLAGANSLVSVWFFDGNWPTVVVFWTFTSILFGKMKYYHASKYRHSPGEVLAGKSNSWDRVGLWVFMTTSPIPHYTIRKQAVAENWFIYEVKPIGKVKIGQCWDEALARFVEVTRRVGHARGIDINGHKRFKPKPEGRRGPGSFVWWKLYIKGNREW